MSRNALTGVLIKFRKMKTLERATDKPELHYVFQLTKKITFDVNFYRLDNNTNQYFTTSANVFNQPKTDYSQCGQCQESVLFGEAKKFYKKWDIHHCKALTDNLYNELLQDIEVLKAKYNYIFSDRDISFDADRALSKLPVKTTKGELV